MYAKARQTRYSAHEIYEIENRNLTSDLEDSLGSISSSFEIVGFGEYVSHFHL